MSKKEIKTPEAPEAIGPYSQGIRAGELVFVSGQIPVDPRTGAVSAAGVGEQTRAVLNNIRAILGEAGCGLNDVVKTTVYMCDLNSFNDMNGVYSEFFTPPFPARATVEVRALPKGVSLEIDAIAMKRKP